MKKELVYSVCADDAKLACTVGKMPPFYLKAIVASVRIWILGTNIG